MTGLSSRRPAVTGFAIFTLLMVAAFTGLGIWQLQRRVEKHALIAMLNERLAAAPAALPARAQWNALTPAKDEFRRVSFTATYAPVPDAMVYSAGSAVRDDVSGPGTWAFLPAQLADGNTIVVNTGFVQNTMQDRNQQDRAVGRLITGDPVELTGYIRFPESAGTLTPPESMAKRLWFTRDHLAMARALGWGEARQGRRAVLCRSGNARARERHSKTRPALRASQGRSPAIRHHLVHAGVCGRHRLRCVVARAAPRLRSAVPVFNRTSLQEPLFRTIVSVPRCVPDNRPFSVHSRRSPYSVSRVSARDKV